ncbi:hypothetical protein HELRODRAFT_184045 [Helobdella robusta]|uniref:Uncharacterized protein n=1 Tax=Helobdella robusta TaxID=6412 RepID=T1FKH2_HELRO|nr:hypothetical protein HELRODRAFT_184045 [Helobdella robusta]ESO08669.1 hypothetical protein HELRODRAFT_184045 [Helobdella robusta]
MKPRAPQQILDSDFYGLNIQRLLLANNSISELRPLSFWGLGNSLETLDLSYNKLRKVPNEALKLLIKLKTLVLTGNAIQSIGPHELGFMKSLEVLTLDKNPITSIHPSFISGSNNLNLLSLDAIKLDKKLESVAAINANNVKGLSLTRNHLTFLPPRWGVNFTLLTLLNLGHNRLGDVIKMEDCFVGMEKSLKNLDLHSNHFLKNSKRYEHLPCRLHTFSSDSLEGVEATVGTDGSGPEPQQDQEGEEEVTEGSAGARQSRPQPQQD